MNVEKKREKFRSEAAHLDALISSAESVRGDAVNLNRKLTAELEDHEGQLARLQAAGLSADKAKAGLKREAKQVDKTTVLAAERSADLSKAIDQLKRELELKVQYIKYAEAEKRVDESRVTQLREQITLLENQLAQLRASEQRLVQIRQQIAS
jgi:chromosome segregation ATPase